jgi:hypothetical protein
MTLLSENVRVGLDGRMYSAPLGTTLPTAPDEVLDDAVYIDHGWLDKDSGIFVERYTEETKVIQGAQGGVTVRKLTTSSDHEVQTILLETKGSNLELYYKGSQVEDLGGGASQIKVRPPRPDHRVFIFDVIDGDSIERHIIPDGEVTGRAERKHELSDASKFDITITGYPLELDGDDFTSVAVKLFLDAGALEEIGS